MKTAVIIALTAVAILVGGVWWSSSLQKNDPDVVARNGLHWHPQLFIFVKGRQIEIPQNIGIGAVHQPMHTHDDLPNIHLEFEGVVREQDLKLGNFFRNWGRDIRSFGANMTMTVNGETNTEYGNYVLRDGDKVELRYE